MCVSVCVCVVHFKLCIMFCDYKFNEVCMKILYLCLALVFQFIVVDVFVCNCWSLASSVVKLSASDKLCQ